MAVKGKMSWSTSVASFAMITMGCAHSSKQHATCGSLPSSEGGGPQSSGAAWAGLRSLEARRRAMKRRGTKRKKVSGAVYTVEIRFESPAKKGGSDSIVARRKEQKQGWCSLGEVVAWNRPTCL